jgi:hypothetical protein
VSSDFNRLYKNINFEKKLKTDLLVGVLMTIGKPDGEY